MSTSYLTEYMCFVSSNNTAFDEISLKEQHVKHSRKREQIQIQIPFNFI